MVFVDVGSLGADLAIVEVVLVPVFGLVTPCGFVVATVEVVAFVFFLSGTAAAVGLIGWLWLF